MILIIYIRGGAKSAFPVCCCASLEGQPVFGVVDEDLVHLVLRDAPRQHLRHDVVQDVRVAMTAVLGEAVLGVDVVRNQHLVLVALFDEKRQAAATRERMTMSGKGQSACLSLLLHLRFTCGLNVRVACSLIHSSLSLVTRTHTLLPPSQTKNSVSQFL